MSETDGNRFTGNAMMSEVFGRKAKHNDNRYLQHILVDPWVLKIFLHLLVQTLFQAA